MRGITKREQDGRLRRDIGGKSWGMEGTEEEKKSCKCRDEREKYRSQGETEF